MKIVVISVGVGSWHPRGIDRLESTLKKSGYKGDIKLWKDEYPPNSPSHQEIPYAFKASAFQWAIDNNYDYALWLDSAIYVENNIEPIIDYIKENEYLIFNSASNTGSWSTDEQLNFFGYSREDAFKLPHAIACIIGFKLNHPALKDYINNTNLFKGPWTNNGEISNDNRVLGSRHDQTVLSLIACKRNLTFTNYDKWGDPYTQFDSNIFISSGGNFLYPKKWDK